MSALSLPTKAPAWGPLYRVGGLAGLLVVLSGVVALILYSLNAPPVSGGKATLRFIADHKASYIAQQLLWLLPSLFGLIVFVALLIALFPTSPNLAVLGFAVGEASWTALLAVPVTREGTLSLVYLSDQYTAATDPTAKSAFVAAAEAFVAENTVSIAGVLIPLGILLISLPMVRGSRIGRLARDCHGSPRPSQRGPALRDAGPLRGVRAADVGVVRRRRRLAPAAARPQRVPGRLL